MANAVELLDRQTSQSLNDSMATYYTTKQNIVFVAQELVENLAYLANTDVQTRKTNIIRNSLFRNRSKINTTVPPVAPQPVVESPKAAEIKSSTEDLMNLFNDAPATAAGTVVEPVHTPAPPPAVAEVIAPPPPMAEPAFVPPPPPVIEAMPSEPVYTPPPPMAEPASIPPAPSAIGGFDELDSFFAEPATASAAIAQQSSTPPVEEAAPVMEEMPTPVAARSSTADLLGLFDEFATAPSAPPKPSEPVYTPPAPPVIEAMPSEPEPIFTPPPPVAEPVYTPPVVEMRPPEPEPFYAPPPPVAEPVYTPPVVEMRPPEPEPVFAPPPTVAEPVYTPPVIETMPPEPVFAAQVAYEAIPETPAQDLDELKHKLSTTNSSVMISPSIKNNFTAILMEIESNLSNMKSYTVNKEALISLYDKLKNNQNMSMQEIVDLSRQIVEANKFVEEYQTKAKDELDSMENVAELFKEMADALVYNIRKAKNDFNRDS